MQTAYRPAPENAADLGWDKVTGRARYAGDVVRPGMLWGRLLRSPYPHARITRIDASRARALPGVAAVLTGQDLPDVRVGRALRDMPVLARDRVRFVGDKVAAVAAEFGVGAEQVACAGGRFGVPGRPALGLADVVRVAGGPVAAQAQRRASRGYEIKAFAAQAAEVVVDPETGQVTVRRYVSANDTGTILNPVAHQGQIDGGVGQGLGYALTEEIRLEDGRVQGTNLHEYKLPSMPDLPPFATVLLEPDAPRPKPIGETASGPVAPAIANAVLDATGVPQLALPITAERLHAALRGAIGSFQTP